MSEIGNRKFRLDIMYISMVIYELFQQTDVDSVALLMG